MFYCLAAVAEIRQAAALRGEQTEKEKPEGFSGIEVIMELCLEQVSKSFQDNRAVDDVSLRITPGVWGLLGANGAGKTTLMRMIAGILKPDKGRITYDGIRIYIGSLSAFVEYSMNIVWPGPKALSASCRSVMSS